MLSAFRLSFGAAALAAAINAVFGLAIAWVLVRYRLPFRRLIDALIGPTARLDLELAGQPLEAVIEPERLSSLRLAVGDTCALHLNRPRIFPAA
ncbi:MAG: hypothetical protein GC191_16430 [Azospirillum sp.]|nr:hypothetical protein [Azospirillum sp.]